MYRYNPPKPKKYLFSSNSKTPFKLSRSSIDSFVDCKRCFYLDKKLGVARPPGYPFTLNSAVDYLLKKEFDILRQNQQAHPLMEKFGIEDVVPYPHKDLDVWRENFKGIRYLDPKTNLLITGAIDDVWVNTKTDEIHIVDYKSTSKNGEVSLDADWQDSYKRQMEVYQWLFRKNGFDVSNTGYFVYCNGITDTDKFDAKLEFTIKIIPYEGNDNWVKNTLEDAKKTLISTDIPEPDTECDYCKYRIECQKLEAEPNSKRSEKKEVTDTTKKKKNDDSAGKFSDGRLF